MSKAGTGLMIASTLYILTETGLFFYHGIQAGRYANRAQILRSYSERPNETTLAEFDAKSREHNKNFVKHAGHAFVSSIPLVGGLAIHTIGLKRDKRRRDYQRQRTGR